MRQIAVLLLTLFVFSIVQAQEKAFTLSYGDVTTDVEDTSVEATGWRVDALFEHSTKGGIIHGLGIGWIETEADVAGPLQSFTNYKLQSLPIYYAPKFTFGQKALKGFLKGALGWHFSEYERKNALGVTVTSEDTGFYGGVSLGASFAFNPKIFMNLEYEWDYLSNSYYKDGYMESIILGIGFKM